MKTNNERLTEMTLVLNPNGTFSYVPVMVNEEVKVVTEDVSKDDTPLDVIQESQGAITKVMESPVVKQDGRKKKV